jgi:hypothetical protein
MNQTQINNQINIKINSSNASFSLDPAILTMFFYVYTIGYTYIYTVLCSIGTLLNLICIIVYISRRFQGNMYKYLINKTVFEFLTLAIGAVSPYGNCQNCAAFQTYGATFFKLYFLKIIINITYTASAVAEIGVTYDRLLLFKSQSKYWPRVNFKHFFAFMLVFSIGLFVPHMFASRLVEFAPNKFEIAITVFGYSDFFNIYIIMIYSIQNFLAFIILIILNFLMYLEYKKYFSRRSRLISSTNEKKSLQTSLHKATAQEGTLTGTSLETNKLANTRKGNEIEKKFTIMIMSSSVFFILSRIMEGMSSIIYHVDQTNKIYINPFETIFSWFAHLTTYLSFSANIIFYFIFNKLFRSTIKEFFCKMAFRSS